MALHRRGDTTLRRVETQARAVEDVFLHVHGVGIETFLDLHAEVPVLRVEPHHDRHALGSGFVAAVFGDGEQPGGFLFEVALAQ